MATSGMFQPGRGFAPRPKHETLTYPRTLHLIYPGCGARTWAHQHGAVHLDTVVGAFQGSYFNWRVNSTALWGTPHSAYAGFVPTADLPDVLQLPWHLVTIAPRLTPVDYIRRVTEYRATEEYQEVDSLHLNSFGELDLTPRDHAFLYLAWDLVARLMLEARDRRKQ